jgi:hypothetical protein
MEMSITDPRVALPEMERVFSRRALFVKIAKGAGVLAAYDRFGPKLFGETAAQDTANFNQALVILSAFGQMVIPVDQDPGWATFDPAITLYTLDVYLRQVYSLGNNVALNGLTQAIVAFNNIPPLISYGPTFLTMSSDAQGNYLTDILIQEFENNGVQDILSFAGIFMLLGAKQVFFQNFPHHLAVPGVDIQMPLGNTPKTGWDIMGYAGPVQAAEESTLRARAANAPEYPGVDWRNPYI